MSVSNPSNPLNSLHSFFSAGFGEWLIKRGILFGMISSPMIALVISVFFRRIDYPSATAYFVLTSFILLPVWVLLRRARSNDPDEPVHHLPKYALYSILPIVFYNVARVPCHFLLQIVFWDHWYDYGSEFTGNPVDQFSSLIPGTYLHVLQGFVLCVGFFVLFKRHSLLNALAYVGILLSVVYTWMFPTFVLVDYQPPFKWYLVIWIAHFAMAIGVWLMPRFWTFWDGPRWGLSKAALAGILIGLYVFPLSFVWVRAATWQFPLQTAIDQNTFNQVKVVLQDKPMLKSVDSASQTGALDAHYTFSLRLGPYKDYINATKAMDAGPITITAHLLSGGEIVAWCNSVIPEIETPNNLKDPLIYPAEVKRLEYTDLPAECVGPASAAQKLGGVGSQVAVDLQWKADVNLVGDRSQEQRTYEGGK